MKCGASVWRQPTCDRPILAARTFFAFPLTTSVIALTTVVMKTATLRPTKSAAKSLKLRLLVQLEELTTCTTLAQVRCVEESIADTRRQLAEVSA